jgi:hypothetical protein
MHQQFPSGVQLIAAPHFEHRVSMQRFSPNLGLRAAQSHLALRQCPPKLTPLRICGKLVVYAAWFLRSGKSGPAQSWARHAISREVRTLLPLQT